MELKDLDLSFFEGKIYKPPRFIVIVDDSGEPILNEKGKRQSRPPTDNEKVVAIATKWSGVADSCEQAAFSYDDSFYRRHFGQTHDIYSNILLLDGPHETLSALEERFSEKHSTWEKIPGFNDAIKFIYLELKALIDSISD